MINYLGSLRESFIIGEKEYFINTDFRVWIEIDSLFRKKDYAKALCLAFREIPDDPLEGIKCMIDFLNLEKKGGQKRKGEKLYDFVQDSGLILSSFLQAYSIDLTTEYMHWYTFITLLFTLPEETPFSKAFYYRSIDISGEKNKERMKFLKKMKRIYTLKDEISDGEIADSLGGAF